MFLKKYNNLPLRLGVGIVLLNSENKIFVGKRIEHAWVETKNLVWDWQMHGRGRKEGLEYVKMWIDDEKKIEKYFRKGFDKKEYYKIAKVKVDDIYDKDGAFRTMAANRNMGPW